MTLQELKEQIDQLSTSDRLTLISLIIESIQREHIDNLEQRQLPELPVIPGSSLKGHLRSRVEQTNVIHQMRGFLKTDQPAPTDSEVKAMLEQRLVEKYL
ncbi:RAMP superfamily CRISPR-associated protein [Nostoc sp. CMAA1605]|uniref:RAMP superfamily CRISPR-associated protein n=1 Tax=Nostoc sp. CMAA1605 TaxID=2055159 RepID=UPI001F28A078|nr:RAMP superfamily CRISPR-associated protein [Nostoc sp. CMAA1605]MCF4968836.1 hypothetical protein [Nostoc sp. CMAA1605]